jgi:hypothetical protein
MSGPDDDLIERGRRPEASPDPIPFPAWGEAGMAGVIDLDLWNETRKMFGLPPVARF